MSIEALETRAEIVKLARLLGRDAEGLASLEHVGADDLRALRELVTDRLFDERSPGLHRAAAASALIPPQIAAPIAERAFGPLLCARIAGSVDPRRAVDVAKRLAPAFLADVAVEMDPRRATDVLSQLPAGKVAQAAEVLAEREEHVAMGRFAGHLPDEALQQTFEVIEPHALLHIAFTLEDKDRLDRAVALMPRERMTRILAAAADGGLWPEALDLVRHLSPEQQAWVANLVGEGEESVREAFIRAAQAEDLWALALPLVRLMNQSGRERFAATPAVQDPDVIGRLVEVAARTGSWPDLLPVAALLPDAVRAHIAAAVERVDPEDVAGVDGDALAAVDATAFRGAVAAVASLDREAIAALDPELIRAVAAAVPADVRDQLAAELDHLPALEPLLVVLRAD